MCCQDLGKFLLHCNREEGLGERLAEREGRSCLSCVARDHGRGGATTAIREVRADEWGIGGLERENGEGNEEGKSSALC